MIRFGAEVCSNLEAALTREWIETNGIGGFASSTIVGLNTRRYHGLLVAAQPPVGRMVLLSKLEETLIVNGHRFELSANRYPGRVHPNGYRYLRQFKLDPCPVFTYDLHDFELEKSVFMIHGENATVVRYEVVGGGDIQLELRPLLAFRDYHGLTHENRAINPHIDADATSISVQPYPGLPILHIIHDGGEVAPSGYWYRRFEYDAERARGLDFVEDLFNPCVLSLDLRTKRHTTVIASTDPMSGERAEETRLAEKKRRRSIIGASLTEGEFACSLVSAADQFIVDRGAGKTVIAGYHWFSDWGRDTMIALPGLTLVTGRAAIARQILAKFGQHVDRGMIPNRFPEAGEAPEYTAVDATLWFFYAVQMYLKHTHDHAFVRTNLYDVLTDTIAWHMRGTRYQIRVDEDGLLAADSGREFAVQHAIAFQRPSILNTVEGLLLTPYGLRTLAPTDRRYQGRYDGDPQSRDAAYHQGTVWPWLMGPFVGAYLRINRTTDAQAMVGEWLKPLRRHLSEVGLGQVSELFDGDPPHRPGGCIAQAWSVAELLRVTLA